MLLHFHAEGTHSHILVTKDAGNGKINAAIMNIYLSLLRVLENVCLFSADYKAIYSDPANTFVPLSPAGKLH
jgi:hypothetical protein